MNSEINRNVHTTEEQTSSVNRLIGEIATMLANAINKENDANGVAAGYRAILFCLAGEDNISQLEISKRVGIKPPTTSVALTKMEAEGYVIRENTREDMRKMIVKLTEKGRETVDNMLAIFTEFDRMVASVLTKEELDTLKELLFIVKKRVSAMKTNTD